MITRIAVSLTLPGAVLGLVYLASRSPAVALVAMCWATVSVIVYSYPGWRR